MHWTSSMCMNQVIWHMTLDWHYTYRQKWWSLYQFCLHLNILLNVEHRNRISLVDFKYCQIFCWYLVEQFAIITSNDISCQWLFLLIKCDFCFKLISSRTMTFLCQWLLLLSVSLGWCGWESPTQASVDHTEKLLWKLVSHLGIGAS